jgi:hypothetical protein
MSQRSSLPQSLQTCPTRRDEESFGGRYDCSYRCRSRSPGTDARPGKLDSPLLVRYDKCSREVRGEKCLADQGWVRRYVMKAIVKIKLWPLIILGLVWLFGTIVPFANGIVRLLTEAMTEIVDAVLPRVFTTEYALVATVLGPLAPAAGSDAEIILRAGLVIVSIAGVGLLIELSWIADRRHHSQRPKTWVCNACGAGNHQGCRGAILIVSRAREGARQCECQHCALNR